MGLAVLVSVKTTGRTVATVVVTGVELIPFTLAIEMVVTEPLSRSAGVIV